MNDIQSYWTVTKLGRDVRVSSEEQLKRWNDIEALAVNAITSAPSWPMLVLAYTRFMRSLGKTASNSQEKPWELLECSSGVMNVKSKTYKTLSELENRVFSESGIPRESGNERFRGFNGVDWEALCENQP